ncbi:hypothetical protein GGH98_004978, partial [Coemansia sp. RSA 454]
FVSRLRLVLRRRCLLWACSMRCRRAFFCIRRWLIFWLKSLLPLSFTRRAVKCALCVLRPCTRGVRQCLLSANGH